MAYAFLPNTKVKFTAALAGGFAAATLWELARYGFFYYVYMSTVNRTLADALGLSVIFLIWVYITWMILLIGNLVVYVTHNYSALWSERRGGGEMMLDGRLLVATMLLVARRFKHHAPGYSEHEIRERLALRKDEFLQIIARLMRAGFVVRLDNGSYHLAQPPEDIRVRDLLEMGCNLARLPIANRIGPVSASLVQLQKETLDVAGDRRLVELLA
jgi:membrane protein